MNPKFFSVDEANSLIGFLDNAIGRIRRNRQKSLWLSEDIAILSLVSECGADEDNADAVELARKIEQLDVVDREIERATSSIRDLGCILKDADRGVVDFFSIQNNTVVYLSWRRGEDEVRFWRPIRERDADARRPLESSPST